jgi:hypothetical protein
MSSRPWSSGRNWKKFAIIIKDYEVDKFNGTGL